MGDVLELQLIMMMI